MAQAVFGTATISATRQGSSASPSEPASGLQFGEILSDLNPLQYLPVIGTIYRAVTGDTIPKSLREAGSIVVGGLLGGPVGVATGLASLAFQKLTGIDFEAIEQRILSGSPTQEAAAAEAPSAPEPAAHAGAWTPAQLAAYGVLIQSDGEMRLGALVGADVLNALQLGSGSPVYA